ncbi:MAG: transcription initiation factor IIB family protein [Halobacteriaceae archaeon]
MGLGRPYDRTFDEDSGKTPTATDCPDCGGTLQTEGGETSCTQCGLVVDTYRIDHGPDWSGHEDDTTTPRTGPPRTVTRHDRGLSTEIGYGSDANGTSIDGRKRRQLGRLRREQGRARFDSKAERNLAYGLGEIARITSTLGLPESRQERASDLFRTAQSEGLLLGRSIESMAAASVYAACRCAGDPRSLEEIQHVARGREARIDRAYRVLNRELALPTKPQRPRGFVSRLASAVDATPRVRRRALELAVAAEEAGLANGRRPSGVAAACLYLAGTDHNTGITQQRVAEVAGVTANTVRTRTEELRELTPPDAEDDHGRGSRD